MIPKHDLNGIKCQKYLMFKHSKQIWVKLKTQSEPTFSKSIMNKIILYIDTDQHQFL